MSASSFDAGDSPFWVDHRSNRNHPYNLNNRIMLSAIISLSLVVLLVIALHIYARYALRRHARRQAVLRRRGILALVVSSDLPPPPRHSGLDPLVMASLPVVVFKHQLENPAAVECAVCLCAVENGEEARVLPNCKHTFHLECIDKWFGLHSTCPICRTEAAPMIRPEPREAPVAESGGGSSSRLSSFGRILSRERSSRRIQPCVRENGNDDVQDLERQQMSM
ncbi:E3 ubiquitin-protein ligase ATL41-like [Cucurbita maxima]|uniref:RING-type E3 ubiquitin transferase n=1 Tax=Cucurbita maxima TaxID=3661 RepID=A0A6J1JP92_CUCMA|nr:E3 ubiquitin-protein ligase ATL41-like [Cucurbita maxima]